MTAGKYDPLPDLAELLIAATWGRRDVMSIADRITDRLGLGEDDKAQAVEAEFRKALGMDVTQAERSEAGDIAYARTHPDPYASWVNREPPAPEPELPDVWAPLAEGACGDGITSDGEGLACGVIPAGHLRRHERRTNAGGLAHWPNLADPETGRKPQPESARRDEDEDDGRGPHEGISCAELDERDEQRRAELDVAAERRNWSAS